MNINYTPDAKADLKAIYKYISTHSPSAASQVMARILQAIAILENFPLLGRPGQVEDTREFSIAGLPYYAVYCIADETEIDVIAIMHERRQYP